MSNYQYLDKGSEYSMIGEGTRLKGEFDLDGFLRIDGDFKGKIKSKGKILIGLNGRAECDIIANEVQIGGMVKGTIVAKEKVEISSTGVMIGNLTASHLIIEEGVIFDGECKIFGKAKIEQLIEKQEKLALKTSSNLNEDGNGRELSQEKKQSALVNANP